MRDLKEMVSVISRHKVKQIEVIGNSTSSDNLFQKLYELVQSPEIETDDDAMAALYPDNGTSKASYQKLKNRFRSRLLNTLFFIDINQSQFTDIQKAFYTCNKNWLAARTLLSRGAMSSGIDIVTRTLREALKYEFTELIIYMCRELTWHYSVVSGNPKLYKHYLGILDENMINLEAETLADRYHTEVNLAFSSSQASKKLELSDKLVTYSNDLLDRFPHVRSFRYLRVAYLLHVTRYQVAGDFDKAIDMCKRALDIYDEKPYQSKGAKFSFSLRLLMCYIQTKDFEAGEALVNSLTAYQTPGSRDWYVTHLYNFLLKTHSGKYAEACEISDEVVSHKRFSNLFASIKQLWLVNQAYSEFLRLAEFAGESKNQNSFRLYKFLNDIPIYSKDKRGTNTSILIVHVLFLLHQKKYSEIIDRVDALNQYCHRYLRRDDTYRTNCFIKMLLQMARADFNRIRTQRYTEALVAKLKSSPLDMSNQSIEVEIIPFEDLWGIILDMLE